MRIAMMMSLVVLVAACGSDGSSPVVSAVTPAAPVAPAPTAGKTSFTDFVNQAVRLARDDEPLRVDDSRIVFNADENPDAFDSLLEGQGS